MIGRVYKISSPLGNEVYVGSTIQSLRQRFWNHKSNSNPTSSRELFDKYGIENCYIELIKEYIVCDKQHLKMYESLWILKCKAINERIPFRIKFLSDKKYREEHKEYNQQWRQEHKEEIKERSDRWRKENPDYHKQWHQKHKDRINKQKETLINCEICNCKVRIHEIRRHERSNKHIKNIAYK